MMRAAVILFALIVLSCVSADKVPVDGTPVTCTFYKRGSCLTGAMVDGVHGFTNEFKAGCQRLHKPVTLQSGKGVTTLVIKSIMTIMAENEAMNAAQGAAVRFFSDENCHESVYAPMCAWDNGQSQQEILESACNYNFPNALLNPEEAAASRPCAPLSTSGSEYANFYALCYAPAATLSNGMSVVYAALGL